MEHRPVLAGEVVDLLLPALEGAGRAVFVDATLGRAGHALRILDAAPDAHLVGIDRDPDALEACRANLAGHSGRVTLVRDDFQDLAAVLERLGVEAVRGVLLDLGVSSPQLDAADRGFSYRSDGPLDMRMDPGQRVSAHDVVNRYEQKDLARVISRYGEERFAARVARAIVARRPVERTSELAEIVRDAIPAATRRTGGHPAKRTFQALRIEVNGEITRLERVLPQTVDVLDPGGRVAVISYHSLEDRTVKRFFNDEARGCTCPPDFPVCTCGAQARIKVLSRRPITPTEDEMNANPRARSAKLRAAERLEPATAPLPGQQRRSA
ncbi:MAG TPA: 16S rRNA (cytosine(1402)-N(4))-methyltransferase RsmH [Actinomycetota bacterium]|nr:16S rRNA (cytosine(1402)-N(4))-methyltransferase RsmH [Actinomycetota bacterium]